MRVLGRKEIDAIYGPYVRDLEVAHRKHQVELKKSQRFGKGLRVVISNYTITFVSILFNQRSKRKPQ
jgi:hypothetical protein